MLSEDEARGLAKQVLALGKADETHVSLSAYRTTNLRFARSAPTTSGEVDNVSINVRSVFGKKSGMASVNQTDRASIEAAVRRAEDAARRAPEDPEAMPGLPAQTYPRVAAAFDDDTAAHGADALADGVARAIELAKQTDLIAAGYVDVAVGSMAIASSTGVFGYHRTTGATLSETFRTADGKGSGWAQSVATRIADLDFAGTAKSAATKATATAKAQPLAAGTYPAILEPSVVTEFVQQLVYSLDRRSADEGRSPFSKQGGGTRLGEALFGGAISLRSDPADRDVPGAPWGGDEQVQAPVTWIDGGKLSSMWCERFWAAKQGIASLPAPSNVLMAGGTGTLDDLIAKTERGVLIGSVWYIRQVDPQTLLYTGLTRDGVFWIENGKIAHAVNNFRWNDSPLQVFKNVVAMSAPVRALERENRDGSVRAPALALSAFELTSVSDAV